MSASTTTRLAISDKCYNYFTIPLKRQNGHRKRTCVHMYMRTSFHQNCRQSALNSLFFVPALISTPNVLSLYMCVRVGAGIFFIVAHFKELYRATHSLVHDNSTRKRLSDNNAKREAIHIHLHIHILMLVIHINLIVRRTCESSWRRRSSSVNIELNFEQSD